MTARFEGDLPFEIQGAEAAKRFLTDHGFPAGRAEIVWDGIAMHASLIGHYKQPEIRLVGEGAGADVIGPDPGQISAEASRRHLAAALEQWHGKYPEVRVRQDVVRGHPARVLASYSARADLVVIGRHGHPSGPGPGIGSIQHAVLDHAHGPVAVVPSGA